MTLLIRLAARGARGHVTGEAPYTAIVRRFPNLLQRARSRPHPTPWPLSMRPRLGMNLALSRCSRGHVAGKRYRTQA